MPMYKKPLLVLLFIAFMAILGIGYTYYDSSNSIDIAKDDNVSTTATLENKNSKDITVYVSGEVNAPGVITLKENSRIADAITACGDFTPSADKDSINLAQKLEDGMQIKVLALHLQNDVQNTAQENAPSKSKTINQSGTDKVNINTADEAELDTLPGIGSAMAKRIIEYRNSNGNFKSIEEIKNVKGIGEAKFSKMQDRLSI